MCRSDQSANVQVITLAAGKVPLSDQRLVKWTMGTTNPSTWYHSNAYSAEAACEHCSGIIRHEPWCITCNDVVAYAYGAILDADKLSLGDRLILHALGVLWKDNAICARNCQALAIPLKRPAQ